MNLHERVPVLWLSRHPHIHARGPWDTGMLEEMFAGRLFHHGLRFDHRQVDRVPDGLPGAIVVLPARHHASDVDWLNVEIARLPSVLLILCGDEEAIFPWREVTHARVRFWLQLPDVVKHGDMPWAYFFGDGWREGTQAVMPSVAPRKDIAWSFAGQVTNERRKRAANGLRIASRRTEGRLLQTAGFTQGMPRDEYLKLLARTWVAPCPGGPATHDTFRFFEALAASAIPVIESDPYWELLSRQAGCDEVPRSFVGDWDGVGGVIEGLLTDRWYWSNVWQDWYAQYRRQMCRRLVRDLAELGLADLDGPLTTAVITVSPSPSHPSLDMILTTMRSARDVAGPDTPIVVAADGVRREQLHLLDRYNEFLYRLYWLAKAEGNIHVIWSPVHRHQAAMTRLAVNLWVDTPNVLFLEHDTPLVLDEPTDFARCEQLVLQRAVDVLRFHHEAEVHPEHEHLMVDHETIEMMGVPLRRTRQWSQRPHLASTAYYRAILRREFSVDARCFIEDHMHSVAQRRPQHHRLAIYHPDGNIKRSYHLDGRQGEPKYDESQVF